ncbi:MAG: hypothetical protein ACOX0B_02600 [Minisyncoccales bacterium]
MKKVFLVILDGLGDRQIEELGNKTPLEAANTPNLRLYGRKWNNRINATLSVF